MAKHQKLLIQLILETKYTVFLLVCQIWKTFLAWCSDIKLDTNDDDDDSCTK